jgi:hypothetical protein
VIQRALLFLVPTYFQLSRKSKDLLSTDALSSDTEALKRLNDDVTLWCVSNEFIIKSGDGLKFLPNITTTDMSNKLCRYIYSLNLKRLRVDPYLGELLVLMKDTEFDKTTSRLIDLHIQIITEHDARFINLYINRLVYALNTLYPNDNEHSWQEIFTDYPYLWLLFPIQRLLRRLTPS